MAEFLQRISVDVCQNPDHILMGQFRLTQKLGNGAFGEVFLAESVSDSTKKFAAKLQNKSNRYEQLELESRTYNILQSQGPVIGFPQVHLLASQSTHKIMLMELLGSSLEDILQQCDKKLTMREVLMAGYQILERIEHLHLNNIIYRDVKPDNILMGLNENANTVYLVDMGLCRKYIREERHIPYIENKQFTGTARFASINTHRGIEQSRRDDIESLGYVIMYLLRGNLPWQGLCLSENNKYDAVMEKKISTPLHELCLGFPKQLLTFIQYARNMKFEDKPDYAYLKNLLKSALIAKNMEIDFVFQWPIRNKNNDGFLKDVSNQIFVQNKKQKNVVKKSTEDERAKLKKFSLVKTSSNFINGMIGSKLKILVPFGKKQ